MRVKKVIFLHASRQRAVQGVNAAITMIAGMVTGTPFTYVFSIDYDDPELFQYYEEFKRLPFPYTVVVGDNRGSVDATNRAAALVTDEDLMFVNGDDLISPPRWDEKLFAFIESIPTNVFLVHLPDGIQNSEDVAIIQCISTGLYRRMGFFFYPKYISMSADTDILYTAKALGAVYRYVGESIGFIHDHPSFKGLPWDATYVRTNRPEAYALGQMLFESRRAAGFTPHM